MTHRTRIKICGLTRSEDVHSAIEAGADALGFVFYAASPRHILLNAVARICAAVPPFVTVTGLFVNPSVEEVEEATATAPVSLLQFHGDETPDHCAFIAGVVNRPFMRAVRVKPETTAFDLLKCQSEYRAASSLFSGLLLDTFVAGYGGSGTVFDWSVIPESIAHRVVLSGGLDQQNVTRAVRQVRPYGVDVSSGVERDQGIKDADKIRAFIAAVRAADANPDANVYAIST